MTCPCRLREVRSEIACRGPRRPSENLATLPLPCASPGPFRRARGHCAPPASVYLGEFMNSDSALVNAHAFAL